MLYGVIDIGSNTIRLMIYRVDNGAIHPVLNNKFAAGLAGYITAKGKMSKEGIRKAVEVLTELGIDPAMRAENISVAQYCLMANWLSDNLPTKES